MVIKVLKKIDCGWYYKESYYDVLVDDDDWEWVKRYRWVIVKHRNTYYAKTRFNGKYYFMHHMINGVPVKPFVTDHIDRNGLNNHRDNLRIVTKRQNCSNISPNKSCRYPGVCLDKSKKEFKYMASIQVNGSSITLGRYKTPEEAFERYKEKLVEIGEELV